MMHALIGAIPRRDLRDEDMLEVVGGIGMDVSCRVRSASDVGLECTSRANLLMYIETEAMLLCKLWKCFYYRQVIK